MLAGRCRGFLLKVKGKQICIRYLWLGGVEVQVLNREAKMGAESVAMANRDLVHFRAGGGNTAAD